jgi:predicted Fe-Mo cluster-binding NifX family protein
LKLVIPVLNDADLDSQVSDHFGRAPYFAVVKIDDKGVVQSHEITPNVSEHMGGFGKPADHLLKMEPDAIVAMRMGPKAIGLFQNAKVAVLRTKENIVRDVISAFKKGELVELTEGCLEARHPE